MDWNADFAGLPPVELPDGRKLETLADCRAYILALPEREQVRWERTVALLLKAAEQGGGWPFLARVSFANVLHGVSGVEPPPTAPDKNAAWKATRAARKTAMTIWIYIDSSKQVGDADHVKAFASDDAARAWFAEHDPEGVALAYPIIGAALENRSIT